MPMTEREEIYPILYRMAVFVPWEPNYSMSECICMIHDIQIRRRSSSARIELNAKPS